MDIAQLLTNTGRHLASQGTTAGQLAALEFSADGSGIVMRASARPQSGDYPGLDVLLSGIGRTLRDAGMAMHQLRFIRFFEEHAGIELVDDTDRPVTYIYPIVPPAIGAATMTQPRPAA